MKEIRDVTEIRFCCDLCDNKTPWFALTERGSDGFCTYAVKFNGRDTGGITHLCSECHGKDLSKHFKPES